MNFIEFDLVIKHHTLSLYRDTFLSNTLASHTIKKIKVPINRKNIIFPKQQEKGEFVFPIVQSFKIADEDKINMRINIILNTDIFETYKNYSSCYLGKPIIDIRNSKSNTFEFVPKRIRGR